MDTKKGNSSAVYFVFVLLLSYLIVENVNIYDAHISDIKKNACYSLQQSIKQTLLQSSDALFSHSENTRNKHI